MLYDLDIIFLKEPSAEALCEAEEKAEKKASKVWTKTHAVLGGETTNFYGRRYENLSLSKAIEIVRRVSKLESISGIAINEEGMRKYNSKNF